MSFTPIKPVVNKVLEKGVEFAPVIVPGIRYIKTVQKVTKFTNPVKATTYTAGLLFEICGGKIAKYAGLCAVWATTSVIGMSTGNPALIALGLEAGNEILEDFYGQ